MKSVIIVFILALGAITSHVEAQSNLSLLQNFMRDVINPNIKESVIIDTYLCRYLHDAPDKLENKNYMFVRGQIKGIREYMQKENASSNQLEIYKYTDIPIKDQNISFEEKDDIYACYYNKNIFNFFAVKDGRITAFNTMNKAGRRFFISHCQ